MEPNQAKIANAIFPERPEGAFERLAEQAWARRGSNALPKKLDQPTLILRIEPSKLLFRVFVLSTQHPLSPRHGC